MQSSDTVKNYFFGQNKNTISYLNRSQFSFYYRNKGMTDMLLPKYQLLVHSILKRWMALKTRSKYLLLFISEQLASFALPRVAGIN